MSLQGLPLSVWYRHVRPHLSTRDVGLACMLVSHEWYDAWVADGAWETFKTRVLAECPEWRESLFDAFPMHPHEEREDTHAERFKRRRTEGGIRGGTWFVLRAFVLPLRSALGVAWMCETMMDKRPEEFDKREQAIFSLFAPLCRMMIPPVARAHICETQINWMPERMWFSCLFALLPPQAEATSFVIHMAYHRAAPNDSLTITTISALTHAVNQSRYHINCMLTGVPVQDRTYGLSLLFSRYMGLNR